MDGGPQTILADEPLSEDRLQRRRAKFALVVAGIGAVAATATALQFVRFGQPFMSMYMAVAATSYMVTWIFYRRRAYRAAPLYLAVTALLAMSLANILLLRREAGDHQFLLLVAALTPLGVHSRDRGRGVLVTVLATLVFVAVEFLDWHRPFEVSVNASQAGQYRGFATILTVVFMVSMIVLIDQRLRAAQEDARVLHLRSESLLRSILPASIVERLKTERGTIAERRGDVSVLFADLVGFTPLASSMPPEEVVGFLDGLFSAFDRLASQIGLEKIKTIGDSYMAVAGLPVPRADHAHAAATMALALRDEVVVQARALDYPLQVRIGIHSGDVVAGVIGESKFAYDLWGEAVNTASRMESHGLPGEIQVSSTTRELIKGAFVCESRGSIDIKGMGVVETWLLQRANALPSDSSLSDGAL